VFWLIGCTEEVAGVDEGTPAAGAAT